MIRHSPRVIGERNSALLDALSDTYAAALRLAELGCEIAAIDLRPEVRPRVAIADPGRRLRHLHVESIVSTARTRLMRADTPRCIIEWEVQS